MGQMLLTSWVYSGQSLLHLGNPEGPLQTWKNWESEGNKSTVWQNLILGNNTIVMWPFTFQTFLTLHFHAETQLQRPNNFKYNTYPQTRNLNTSPLQHCGMERQDLLTLLEAWHFCYEYERRRLISSLSCPLHPVWSGGRAYTPCDLTTNNRLMNFS